MPLLRTLAFTAAATGLTTAMALAPTQASAAVPRNTPGAATYATVLVNCFGQPRVIPGDVLLACGDGNDRLGGLYWTSWDRDSAVGSGYEEVNDCDPYCAAGTFHTFAVTVRLSGNVAWPGDPHLRRYTTLTISYLNRQPWWSHSSTYELWDGPLTR